jgi:hypothetical protein
MRGGCMGKMGGVSCRGCGEKWRKVLKKGFSCVISNILFIFIANEE